MAKIKRERQKDKDKYAGDSRANIVKSENYITTMSLKSNEELHGDQEPDIEADDSETGDENGDEAARRADTDAKEINNINQTGMVVTKKNDVTINSLTVIGQIEGHYALPPNNKTTKYEHIIPHLVAIEDSPEIDGLLIILNTVGGDVEAGLAIAEMIASMQKPTVSLVLGGGHSIGVPLAVCAKKSFIVPTATMTIHPVRMNGLVVGVEQSFSYFTKMQERINRFILSHSNISDIQLRQFMFNTGELATDVGSIVDGESAIKYGLIDKIGGLSNALDELREMCKKEKKAGKTIGETKEIRKEIKGKPRGKKDKREPEKTKVN